MTRRERVIAALTHQNVHPVPFSVDFTQQERARVAAFLGDDHFTDEINNHISSAYYDGHLWEIKPDFWQDDFGVCWNRTGADKDIGVIAGLLIPEPDLSAYRFPEIDTAQIHHEYQALMARKDDTFKMGSIGFSLFERAWTLRGMENLLMDMVLNPDFVDQLFQAILEYNSAILEIGLDIYQTVQPEIYDLPLIKKEYGRDLSFWGGISTQRLLPFATPDEVRRVTQETLHIMGEGGGYIAAPTHAIPGDVPPENVLAMLEVLQRQT